MTDRLACPRCAGALEATLKCAGCGKSYPMIGKVPWLFADPEAKLAEWRGLVQLGFDDWRIAEERLKSAQREPGLTELTLRRLRKELQLRVERRKAVESLLEPIMKAQTPGAGIGVLRVVAGKSAATQALHSYEQNALRDWAWTDSQENDIAAKIVRGLVPDDARPKSMLVLGAGACRLPYDLHRALRLEETVALDTNPYLTLTAARLLSGRATTLYEFPLAPVGLEQTAVSWRAETAAEPGIRLVFGDALAAPFADESFDIVLTPWLIDILPEEPRAFFARINRLVKPGGLWLNFGSVAFQGSAPERRLSREEVLDEAGRAGFAVEKRKEDVIPYLASPASAQSRMERILAFAARKTGSVPAPAAFSAVPAWLKDPRAPIPRTEHLQKLTSTHVYYADVFGLVDGRRSIEHIALALGEKHRLPPAELMPALLEFFAAALGLDA